MAPCLFAAVLYATPVIMKKIQLFLAALCITAASCQPHEKRAAESSASLDTLLQQYWEERMQLFPFEATAAGDNRYNDRLTIAIAPHFRGSLQRFYQHYREALRDVDSSVLDESDLLSYRIFRYEMDMNLEGLKYPTHLTPINQFWAFTLEFPQYGSGDGNQPFKTRKDYEAWHSRMRQLPAWVDTTIVNMREGMQRNYVLPKALVEKMLPQVREVVQTDVRKSIFWGPITKLNAKDTAGNLPLPATDTVGLARLYREAIANAINPAYERLHAFLKDEYLPAARASSGVSALPGGGDYYRYCTRFWTTTNLTPDSIFKIGEAEVARIEGQMQEVMRQVHFTGDLQAFFSFIGENRRFFPFTTPQQVLDSFQAIQKAEEAGLKKLFNRRPRTAFTVRQTEAFRAASASAEYNPGTADGTRPGIFYVPILDAKEFNAVGMETLFLHEAIPGHHYQISLQQEDTTLPQFRRFLWYGAYGEGWALYSESLGRELGVFTNPYQYFGHLSDAMHRAIRLVVDVGLHTKGWTREQAIDYMLAHERISRDEATAEIERYMAIPGQALSYKIGQLGIRAERAKWEKELGSKFDLASFHDAVLRSGVVPLGILEENLKAWAEGRK